MRRHEGQVQAANPHEQDREQDDAPEPAEQQADEDRAHDIGEPDAAEPKRSDFVERPRHPVSVSRRSIRNSPPDRNAENEHPWNRGVAPPRHGAQHRVETWLGGLVHNPAGDELREVPYREPAQRGLAHDQQRHRDETAHLNAVMHEQRLSDRWPDKATVKHSPNRDRDPGHERNEDGAPCHGRSIRRNEMHRPLPPKRRLVVNGREGACRRHRGSSAALSSGKLQQRVHSTASTPGGAITTFGDYRLQSSSGR
jgi:hypothetical protein